MLIHIGKLFISLDNGLKAPKDNVIGGMVTNTFFNILTYEV